MNIGIDRNSLNMWVHSDALFQDGRVHHIKYDKDILKDINILDKMKN